MAFNSWQELPYRAIYAVDTEFFGDEGNIKTPLCLVVRNLLSDTVDRYWQEDLHNMRKAPFDTGPEALFVAYYAPAELGVFKALGWPMPERIFDCYVEFVCETNGQILSNGKKLLGAMSYFNIQSIGAEAKAGMYELILSGGPWDQKQKSDILDYCQSDVDALAQLFPSIVGKWINDELRLGQALLRGRYMAAVACMEHVGIPIDVPLLNKFWANWDHIKFKLIEKVDCAYGVYEEEKFKEGLFEEYLIREGIPWPRLPSGKLALDRETFKTQKTTLNGGDKLYH